MELVFRIHYYKRNNDVDSVKRASSNMRGTLFPSIGVKKKDKNAESDSANTFTYLNIT